LSGSSPYLIGTLEEKYKDFDESEYYSKFGEELHKSEEYDTTGKDTSRSTAYTLRSYIEHENRP